MTVATTGDTIDVLGNLGDYTLGGGSVNPGAKTLHFVGVNGVPRLIANGSADTLEMTADGSSATNLYLENDGNGDGLFVSPMGGMGISVDRVFVKTTGSTTTHTCFLGGSITLTNSVCWQANSSAHADGITTEFTNTLRNDASWVTGGGAGVDCLAAYGDCNVTVVNTVTRATGAGGNDLQANAVNSSFSATVTATYSNFATTHLANTTAKDKINTDASDQSATPALVNPGIGDFHELSSSPTINAGITSPANGARDLDGNPRTVNGKTDIGAYELGTPGPPPSTLIPPDTTITKSKVKKHKHKATFSFSGSGNVTGFQCALAKRHKHKKPKLVFTSCSSPKTYKHLKHGKYTFEVRAFNAAGKDPTPAVKKFKV